MGGRVKGCGRLGDGRGFGRRVRGVWEAASRRRCLEEGRVGEGVDVGREVAGTGGCGRRGDGAVVCGEGNHFGCVSGGENVVVERVAS